MHKRACFERDQPKGNNGVCKQKSIPYIHVYFVSCYAANAVRYQ